MLNMISMISFDNKKIKPSITDGFIFLKVELA